MILRYLFLSVLLILSWQCREIKAQTETGVGPVVRISGVNAQKEPVFATAFLVQAAGNRQAWLVTAAHVFRQIAGEKIELILRRQYSGRIQAFSQAYQIRKDGQNLFFADRHFDVAAFLLELPADCSCSLLSPSILAREQDFSRYRAGVGSKLLVYGFPYGEYFDQTGNCIVRSAIISSSPLLPAAIYPDFLVDFEVFAGYSGAPVLLEHEGKAIFVGMVLEEVFVEELRSQAKKVLRTRHGLGLARVLNSIHVKNFIESLHSH
jgi:hypothetical protein